MLYMAAPGPSPGNHAVDNVLASIAHTKHSNPGPDRDLVPPDIG